MTRRPSNRPKVSQTALALWPIREAYFVFSYRLEYRKIHSLLSSKLFKEYLFSSASPSDRVIFELKKGGTRAETVLLKKGDHVYLSVNQITNSILWLLLGNIDLCSLSLEMNVPN